MLAIVVVLALSRRPWAHHGLGKRRGKEPPDDIWPEEWWSMSPKQKDDAIREWVIEKPIRYAARNKRNRWYIPKEEEEEFFAQLHGVLQH